MSYKPGTYDAVAVGGQVSKSAEKGTPFIEVTFKFDHEGTESTIRWRGYTTEKAKPFTLATLATLGFNGKTGPDGSINADAFTDAAAELVLAEENYTDRDGNPKTTTKVQYVNSPGAGGAKSVGSAQAVLGFDLVKEMKIAAAEAGKKPTTNPKNMAPKAKGLDDELPF